MTSTSKPTQSPRFQTGAKVRVKYGVTDPDFDDIPLGGWTGTIQGMEEEDDEVTVEVKWDERTLAGMHPVYRKRCERDDCEVEFTWLEEEDLEADDGTPVPIEQPTEIQTPPLSEKDQDDRVRMVFGLTTDDPLPEISHNSLSTYYRYLAANLKFPFAAFYDEEEIGPFSRKRAIMTATGLLEPDDGGAVPEDGLICTGRDRDKEIEFPLSEIDLRKRDRNFKLVSDYAYWFCNWPTAPESDTNQEPQAEDVHSHSTAPRRGIFLKSIGLCAVAGGILGASIGAALQTIRSAELAALCGGIPLAMIVSFFLGRYGVVLGAVNRIRYVSFLGASLGLVLGAVLGVFAGLTLLAFPWSLICIIAGAIIGPFLVAQKRRALGSLFGIILGGCSGIFVAAYRQAPDRALQGASSGVIAGFIVGAGLFLALIAALYALTRDYQVADAEPGELVEDDAGGPRPRRF